MVQKVTHLLEHWHCRAPLGTPEAKKLGALCGRDRDLPHSSRPGAYSPEGCIENSLPRVCGLRSPQTSRHSASAVIRTSCVPHGKKPSNLPLIEWVAGGRVTFQPRGQGVGGASLVVKEGADHLLHESHGRVMPPGNFLVAQWQLVKCESSGPKGPQPFSGL